MKQLIIQLARRVGQALLTEFKKPGPVAFHDKDKLEIVTKSDYLAERMILRELRKRFPQHSVLSEESGLRKQKSDYLWVVDPLDGTTNFAIKNPIFSVSIALVYRHQPVLGVVFWPALGEMFVAERDRGAQLNGRKIHIRIERELSESFLTFCHGQTLSSIMKAISLYGRLKLKGKELRQLGSAALESCFVAAGRTDAIIIPGALPWDAAAGSLIVREAGGRVTDFQNRDWTIRSRDFLASNGQIHARLLSLINA